MPVTAYSAPSTLPTVDGTIRSRRLASAAFDFASVPLPTSGIVMRATVLSAFRVTSIGVSI